MLRAVRSNPRSIAALASAALCAAAPARAANVQTTFQVTATVVPACTVSASTLAFGVYDPTSASPTDAATNVGVTCTNGTAYDVGLDAGAGAGATIAARKMTHSADTLSYALYTDASRTALWGDTIGVNAVAGTGSGALQSLSVYGRIGAHQTAPAGAYTDTITVTVTF